MPKKNLTAADRKFFAQVFDLGCCICQMPPEIHHKTGAGMALKSNNREVMPLCPPHHRTGADEKLAIHAGVQTWEEKHGTQDYWIQWTKEQLGEV